MWRRPLVGAFSSTGHCGKVNFCQEWRKCICTCHCNGPHSTNREVNGKAKHEPNASRKERPQKRGGGGRFEPYGNVNKRYRVFVSNIPYDVKWQALKDLMKDKGKVLINVEVQLIFF